MSVMNILWELMKRAMKRWNFFKLKLGVSKGQITISSDPSPLFGIQFFAIPFAFDFAFKMHIKEKSFKNSIN